MDYKFEEYKKGSENHKSLWAYFLRERNGQMAKCKTCSKIIKCAGGSTSSLHSHLRTTHKITAAKRRFEDCGESGETSTNLSTSSIEMPSSSKKITEYFLNKKDDSLAAVISRLTAKDGLAFSLFCTSDDLRSLLSSKGFRDIPKSSNTIRKIVLNYGQSICNIIENNLSDMKNQGCGFSLTFDEWTSISNRRYLNINVHTKQQFWNLGLIRIIGSSPAEKCIQMLEEKLTKFGISLSSDIICITTDGASVMRKIGRLLQVEQQFCFAHAIQLAILKVLYCKDKFSSFNIFNENEQTENNDMIDINNDSESDADDEELLMNAVNPDQMNFTISNDEYIQQELNHKELLPLIYKIRKIVKVFKNSPVKNDDTLQKYVVLEFGKEKQLVLDSKTRWNSLLFMFERFHEIRTCVQKSLIDLKSPYSFSDDEFKLLSETIAVLLPMKLGVESLCRQDANLLTADATFNFMLLHLDKCSGQLALDMKKELLYRIKERRTDLSSLLQYLHNKYQVLDAEKNPHVDIFWKLPKPSIHRLIVKIIERISSKSINDGILSESDDIIEIKEQPSQPVEKEYEPPTADVMKNLLQKAIDHQLTVPPQNENPIGTSLNTTVRRELTQFEASGVRGPELEKVYNFLLSIPPTSVEAERAFSASGNICTKIRSRLADNTIDMLCLMRSYFLKQKNK